MQKFDNQPDAMRLKPVEIESIGFAHVSGTNAWVLGDGHHRFCAAVRMGRNIQFRGRESLDMLSVRYIENLKNFAAGGVHWRYVKVVERLQGSVFDPEQKVVKEA